MNPQKHNINTLFHGHKCDPTRDRDFILTLIANPNLSEHNHAFLHFIEESGGNLEDYMEFIKALCRQICANRNAPRWHFDSESLARCIIKLYMDNSTNSAIVNDVMNMWDELYKSNAVSLGMEALMDE